MGEMKINKVWRPEQGWMILEFVGERAYTNGHFILHGEPPDSKTAERTVAAKQIEAQLPRRTKALKFLRREAAVSEGWPALVYFEDLIYPIQAAYYDHVLSCYPDAVFRAPLRGLPTGVVGIESKKKIVGAIMTVLVPA